MEGRDNFTFTFLQVIRQDNILHEGQSKVIKGKDPRILDLDTYNKTVNSRAVRLCANKYTECTVFRDIVCGPVHSTARFT
jgi:hypothetical protein